MLYSSNLTSSLIELKAQLLGYEHAHSDQQASDAERIDQLRLTEEIKGVLAAVQARVTTAFTASQRADQRANGVPAERVGRGVAAQVGLARRISPFEATRYVGQVEVLTRELPATFARLASGEVPEWRVLLVARETAWLSAEHRAVVDAEVAPQLERLGKRRTIDLVKRIAYRLDPYGYLARLQQAEAERHVSLRPVADGMTRLSALLPLPQGVAVYAALNSAARAVVGVGAESRSRSQLMADLLVERVTGQASAHAVPIAVNLIMTDQTMFTMGDHPDEPAVVAGGGTIPAELARRMLDVGAEDAAVFVRRLYTNPTNGQLAAMDSQSRLFTANQRHFLLLRDQSCRTPWCDADIRHADHIRPAEYDGPTTTENGQGICEADNYAKTAPGWSQYVDGEEIVTVTPTRHTYRSRAPGLPGAHNTAA
jgi:hypothetical protein